MSLVNPYIFGGSGFGSGPDTIADLEFWADAFQETGFSDNDQMTPVLDWSGNSRDGTATGTPDKPRWRSALGPNGIPCFEFSTDGSGTGGYFTLPNFLTGFPEGHGFCVIQNFFAAPNASAVPFPDWGSSTDGYYPFSGDSKIYDTFGTNTRKNAITPIVGFDTWHLYEGRSAAGAWSLYQNGTEIQAPVANTVAWGTTPKMGWESGPGRFGICRVSEQFFFSAIKTGGDLTTIKNYITAKTGIILA